MASLARQGWTVAVLCTAAAATLSVIEMKSSVLTSRLGVNSPSSAPVNGDAGSSMTKNYSEQFDRFLSTPGQGYPYLVMKLKAKIASR